MTKAKVIGMGHYLPDRVVTNFDLEKVMDTSDQWIKERTGISERRFFDPEKDTVANMAARASNLALKQSGIDIKDILVVGAEIQSSALEMNDRGRSVSVIFADGAGALILQATDDSDNQGILSTHLHADGRFAEELYVRDPGSSRKERLTKEMIDDVGIRAHMNGNVVFKHAVVKFQEVIHEALEANQLKIDDIDLLIPHQANLRINQFVQKQLGLGDDQVFNNIMHCGNTTAASIPIAMCEAWDEGRLKPDDLLCIAAFGSGFTWA
ncbi:MAG: 3-oxoacyl-ACP synthase, partial [Bacteroidetes bacterium]